MLCPTCLAKTPNLDPSRSPRGERCASCGGSFVVGNAYVIDDVLAGDRAHDAVDGIGVTGVGTDIDSGAAVIVRVAGDDRARFAREANIARGLMHPSVLRVLHHDERATVWAKPAARVIDDALAHGLRCDARSLRRTLLSLLEVLVALADKQPPVHVLSLHGGNVFIDDNGAVFLFDFARATDTAADVVDRVAFAARPGTEPPAQSSVRSHEQSDLYATGVLALCLATRQNPTDLARDANGALDVGVGVVDDALRGFVRGLLRGSFASKRAALAALRALDQTRPRSFPAVAVAGAVAAMGAAVGFLLFASPSRPAKRATLLVAVDPQDAQLIVDDTVLDVVARTNGATVAVGRHHVRATAPGYVDGALDVDVAGTGVTMASLTLAPVPIERHTPEPPPRTPEPPPKEPPPHTPEPPPHTPEPPRTPEAPSADDALLRAIEAAVRTQQAEIEACPDDGSDRIKLHLTLTAGQGKLVPLARADVDAVRCVADSVAVSPWPHTPHQAVEADIWVWRRPSFKVAAY